MTKTRMLLLLLCLALVGCPKATPVTPPAPTPTPVVDHAIQLTWNQSFANNGACSATVTTSCISGFYEGYVTGTLPTTGPATRCSSTVLTNCGNQLNADLPTVCTGTTQPETCTSAFNGVLPIGNVNFYVATTYLDQNGATGVTFAATTATASNVGADGPVNVTVVYVH